ncbi:MAG: YceI family protein [Chlamydiota bacterium]|nr:YceI family protein [Chlamydiota bacterium]
MHLRMMLALGLFLFSFSYLNAATYKLDADHSTVGFKIKHIFSWVQGTFDTFEGSIEYDPENPDGFSATATIQAGSINTRVQKRDQHLQSPDFFDVEKYPTITFSTVRLKHVTPEGAQLQGMLTLHGVEKLVILDLQFLGVATDPWGNELAAFTAMTTIDRKDFGLTWNKVLETGGVLVGDEVVITLDVSAIRSAS